MGKYRLPEEQLKIVALANTESPSWPRELSPQQYPSPSVFTPQLVTELMPSPPKILAGLLEIEDQDPAVEVIMEAATTTKGNGLGLGITLIGI